MKETPRWPRVRARAQSVVATRCLVGDIVYQRATVPHCRSETTPKGPYSGVAHSGCGSEVFVERLGRCSPAEGLAGPAVQCGGDGCEVAGAVSGEVGALREVLAQQTVGVLVGAALPWALWVAEVDLQAGVEPQPFVLGHLGALVPGQRAAQLLGERRDRVGDRVTDRLGAAPCQGRTVLDPRAVVARHRREMQQHREPGRALDQSADRRAPQPQDQVSLPVSGNGTVLGLGRALADQDLIGDEVLPAPRAGSWDPQRPAGTQAGRQLASECAAALDIQRLVDRFVRDPHRLIIREVQTQPIGDLLRAPGLRPAPVLAATATPTDPDDLRATHYDAARVLHRPGETVLHIPPQLSIDSQLGRLRTLPTSVRVPLRSAGPIRETTTTSRSVTAQLAGDRRRRPTEPTCNLTNATPAGSQQRDLLPLSKRQITPRQRGHSD